MSRQQKLASTIMIQGTASDVGKSLLTTALCRIFVQDGLNTAPFKSQNMSLNSYVTWDGKEIGRAQGMQADACGILATTDMNPILLKPKKDMVSQVVVHGRPLRDYNARAYREEYLIVAEGIVKDALNRLRCEYDLVVLEGAGSPVEINLKDRDIVNMRMAAWADAPVILAADIDRGGVFASIVGTLELLEPHERDRVAGFVINKFRGDVSLLQPGLDWLEQRTGKPVLGVVPYLPELGLEAEDSLSLEESHRQTSEMRDPSGSNLDVAVIRLPRISNFTDFDPLLQETDVRLRYITGADSFGDPDLVIIPGSKNTMDDLLFLKSSGLADLLLRHAGAGKYVIGICAGYEMLGQRLLDPERTESDVDELEGLGLLPFEISFASAKRTVRVSGQGSLPGMEGSYPIEGYEIHTGKVRWTGETVHPFVLSEAADTAASESSCQFREGAAMPNGKVWGSFVHGVLHNDGFRRALLNRIRSEKEWPPLEAGIAFKERREAAFDRLAAHVRAHVDIERIYSLLETTFRKGE
ncbi:cobyric acid synthase [Paenibacillus abyssi]|uniref:Cobyric acid synthase n=1 Tax=Paenibacillus abyssi TaxID=1340531 RepID=A0A917D6P3_9BACL|nr:cobyric acid synthase [Paenibacillus abyssi]GGG11610.1 cobyric acid synthase [Paenibacillus abyssi]